MKIFELLEKREQRQIDILLLVLKNHGKITVSELATELAIHKDTIRDDIVWMLETLEPIADRFFVSYETKTDLLTVKSAGTISNIEVYYQFFSRSIAYEILAELFRSNKLKLQAFAMKMAISPATLTRRIRQLNTALQPFDIQIKNGQLQGSEIQIRHLYFNLFWNGLPYEQLKKLVLTNERAAFLTELEKKLAIPMVDWQRVKLALWMNIARKRMGLVKPKQMLIPEFLDHIHVSKDLFAVLYESLALFYGRYAFAFSLEEGKLFYLFFVASFSIPLTSTWWDQILEESRQANDCICSLNQHTLKVLTDTFQKEQIAPSFIRSFQPTLYQIHTRFLYFKGIIYHIDDQGINSLEQTFFELRLRDLCQRLVEEAQKIVQQKEIEGVCDWKKLEEQYHLLLYDTYRNLTTELNIAFNFPNDHSFGVMLKERIIGQIDSRINFRTLAFDDAEVPDIVITSLRQDSYQVPKEQVYVVLNVEYDYDMENILEFITNAYKEKVIKQVMKK